jgi:acetoacetyl-CoA synthetase
MPLRFWNDPNDRAYHAAYFEKTPGMWTHGDLIEFKTDGGVVIHGRSDTTLNPGGIRIGTAEIYRALDTIIEVVDALAAGLRHDSGEEIVLFVVPHKEAKFGNQLKLEIRNAIRTAASPRHVPRYIVAVSDLPKTRNGKLAEISVARILRGESVTNVESLANPEALQEFVEARDLLLADKLES